MNRDPRLKRKRNKHDPVGLSGWLYTDLLLALMVVFLGSITFVVASLSGSAGDGGPVIVEQSALNTSTTTTSSTITTIALAATTEAATATSTTIPTPTTVPAGVESCYFTIQLGRWTSVESMATSFEAELAAQGISGQRVGIVLTFGDTSEGEEIKNGLDRAETFNKNVLPELAETNGSTYRSFYTGSADAQYGYRLELYLMRDTESVAHGDADNDGKCDLTG